MWNQEGHFCIHNQKLEKLKATQYKGYHRKIAAQNNGVEFADVKVKKDFEL